MGLNANRPDYDGAMYYSNNDLSIGLNLQKADNLIQNHKNNFISEDINFILELHNIIKLFKTGHRLKSWTDSYYNELGSHVSSFPAIVGSFFSRLNAENLLFYYSSVCISYVDIFWDAFNSYMAFKHISATTFIDFLNISELPIWHILIYKRIVFAYDAEIAAYMLRENLGAEQIIRQYLVKNDLREKKYYFPKSLTAADKLQLVENYINSESPNTNYLNVIVNGSRTEDFPLTEKIRLLAKRKRDAFWADHFNKNSGIEYGPCISFSELDEDRIINIDNPLEPVFSYNISWIENNLDEPTLLNNFIYLFDFVDYFFRSTFPASDRSLGVFERHIGLKPKKSYNCGFSFSFLDMTSSLQINAYDKTLQRYDIRIEYLLNWFFDDYLTKEFGVNGFVFNSSSSESTFLEKNRHLCSEIDSILKQFNMYVEDSIIDRELLELSTETLRFEQVNSFYPKKYGYLSDSDLETAAHLLFSDQTLLSYTERTKDKYDTFANLLMSEKINCSDFKEFQLSDIDFLIKNEIISKDADGSLHLFRDKCFVLKDLYCNDVLCYSYYDLEYLDKLINANKVLVEGTLFSKPEQEYLDYILNDRKYDDGPKLRNKYVHGTNTCNPSQHEVHYYQLLKILTLIVIKINEEFCRRDDCWPQNEE